LSDKFPEEKDRKLSANFLVDLLTGTLPGIKFRRNGVRISGATIDGLVDLRNSQIPFDEVELNHCQFHGSAVLFRANFAGVAQFDGSTFKAAAIFNSVKVGDRISFRKAVFEGPVDFASADVAGNFVATEARFQSKEKTATFSRMKTGADASFDSAVFEGPVDFGSADIAGNFVANGAQFQSKEKEASFTNVKVGSHCFFNNAVFEGPVEFGLANMAGNFEAEQAKFQNKEKEASFGSMKVGGYAFFTDAVFQGPVNLSYADFAWLDVSSLFRPKDAAQLRMQGMSYKYIRAVPGNEAQSHKALLKLAGQSVYTADVYSNLEAFFLRHGYRADADQAFIAGKRRERDQYLRERNWLRWSGSWLLDKLVGYGRHPWQAGVPCVILVALGYVLFSPKKMEPQKPEDAPRVYNRFWYSLSLFLPFVDLQADKVWKPKADQTFLRNYMRVHILAGWILIPIVLAALTGLIK
jgi:uncharacterized protein YjbI with pentapeptide repeats